MTRLMYFLVAGILLALCFNVTTYCVDWPMWRYDAQRSAASPERLPERLYLQWVRDYPKLEQTWDDPLNLDLMQNDKNYEPVVLGKTMFVGSNAYDWMVALDTGTGQEKWVFYADGPIRYAPAAYNNKLYFTCDDGYLYCLDAETGALFWKYCSVPVERIVLGNERLISSWPARGGPVIQDGVVYFGSGIWPFMGVFLHAVDAETGEEIWVNDGFSNTYIKQPHNSPSFASVAPQGILAISNNKLLVPGGRSVPACFDLRTGKMDYYRFAEINKTGGAFVCANDRHFINYHRDMETSLYDVATGERMLSAFCKIPVFTNTEIYGMGETVEAFDYLNIRQVEYEKKVNDKVTKLKRWEIDQHWELKVDAGGDLIKAGNRLYAGGKNKISAIDLSDPENPKLAWTESVDGSVSRLLAANGRLFAVTLEGRLYAFGGEEAEVAVYPIVLKPSTLGESFVFEAKKILDLTGERAGYSLIYGSNSSDLTEALLRRSDLWIHLVEPDRAAVKSIRKRFVEAGLYGKRLSVHTGDLFSFKAPPYFANLIVVDPLDSNNLNQKTFYQTLFQKLRPYGGIACLKLEADQIDAAIRTIESCQLANAKTEIEDGYLLLSREEALPGSGDWTHQYGNVANTIKSNDRLVDLPLGILWFGGSSHEDVLPRHGHGPPEQIIDGRLFIQGMEGVSARDVYTGRVIWKRAIPDLGTFGMFFDETYKYTPLDPSYNQIHIPGANGRGTNFVVTHDKLYIIHQVNRCLVLDPATGEIVDEIELPVLPGEDEPPVWSYIGVYQDYLIAGGGLGDYHRFIDSDKVTEKNKRFYDLDITSSRCLIVMNRHSGEALWTFNSNLGFLNNAIAVGNDTVFCIDRMPEHVGKTLKRRGRMFSGTPRLFAFDIQNGNIRWSSAESVFGTWLSYSEKKDILLMAGRYSRDMVTDEPKQGMAAYRASDGKPLWRNDASYNSPCILHGDTIVTEPNAYSLLTGELKMRTNSLTGEATPWIYQRNYGCNYATACENLLTFRSAAAGFFDLAGDSGTGNIGGFKSGCTSNLIAADGVLNAPDYTRTCQCSYQNQTSLALIHDPDMEMWTFNPLETKNGSIRQMGINFGAPGDRRAENGILWLEYPVTGGPSPEFTLQTEPENPQWFQHHSLRVRGDGMKWVFASGVEGIRKVILTVAAKSQPTFPYTIRLFFMEPESKQAGERLFDVSIQGQRYLTDFDIVREAGSTRRGIIKTFDRIPASRNVTIELSPSASRPDSEPVLCGLEIVRDQIVSTNLEAQ